LSTSPAATRAVLLFLPRCCQICHGILTATFRPFSELRPPRNAGAWPNLESWSCNSLALRLRAFSTSSRSFNKASTDTELRLGIGIGVSSKGHCRLYCFQIPSVLRYSRCRHWPHANGQGGGARRGSDPVPPPDPRYRSCWFGLGLVLSYSKD